MGKLAILWDRLTALTVRVDVINGAVFERMNLIPAELAQRRLFEELLPECILEKPGLHDLTVDNRVGKGLEGTPSVLRLGGPTCLLRNGGL